MAEAFWGPLRSLVAVALAFASGSIITALAFDLFEESFKTGGVWFSGVGLLVGATALVAADELLDRHIEGAGSGVSGFAILAAMTLDGIPENMDPRRLLAARNREPRALCRHLCLHLTGGSGWGG